MPFSPDPTHLWGSTPDNPYGDYLGWTLRYLFHVGSIPPDICTSQSDDRITAIQLGDFNGDGKMDLVLTGDHSVCIGDYHDPITGSCSGCFPQPPEREFAIFSATGTRTAPFTSVPLSWTTNGIAPYAPFVTVGDFNGDGKTDLLTMDSGRPGRGIVPRISTGSVVEVSGAGFVPALDLSTTCGTVPGAWCFTTPGQYPLPYFDSMNLGDFDGDGSTDLLIYNSASAYGGTRVGVIMGGGDPAADMFSQAKPSAAFPLPAFVGRDGVIISDFNGDGRSDVFDRGAFTVLLSQGTQPALLSRIDNGSAGTITVAYTPSSQWTNHNLRFVAQTVSSISTSDGHVPFMPAGATSATVATTSYTYSGGLWDVIDRRFLGFGRVDETEPCVGSVCPYRDTWYYQYYGSYAKPQQIEVGALGQGGVKTLYSRRWYNYATGATAANGMVPVGPPYLSQLVSEGVEEYDASGQACTSWPCAHGQQTSKIYEYDNLTSDGAYQSGFGNASAIFDYGGSGVTGDETTTTVEFFPNAAAYMTSYAARTVVFQSSVKMAESQTLYDGAIAYTTPPASGLGFVTGVRRWLDRPISKMVESRFEYDSAGNLRYSWDENGKLTTYTYDAAYDLYLASVLNAAGHETRYGWDRQCDKVSMTTDPNNQVVTTTYDLLCRPSTVSRPSAGSPDATGLTTFRYCDDPAIPSSVCGVADGPTAQYVRTEGPSADGNGVQWVEDYYDGAGRRYRTKRKGPDNSHLYSSVDFAFDVLGNDAWTSRPYFEGEAVQWTHSTFDVLDRNTTVIFPDQAGTATSHNFVACTDPVQGATCSRVSVSDPLGHVTSTVSNARGHTAAVTDNRGTTTYTFDVLGRLTAITDAAGSAWSYAPDSLGRNVSVADPDLGTWTYAYDDAGNMLQQTDAKGQTTHAQYDALNRKYHQWSDASSRDYAWWYYDQLDPTGTYFNKGHLTSIADASGSVRVAPGQRTHASSGLQTFNYDARGRLAKWERNVTSGSSTDFTVTKTYDDGDRPLMTMYTAAVNGNDLASFTVGPFTYDGAAKPCSLPDLVSSATYDAAGMPLTRANANGTTLTNTYSLERGWLMTRMVSGPSATTIQAADYGGRDAEGKLARFTNGLTGASWLYMYDAADRMYFAQTSCSPDPKSAFYVYDNVDNITDRYLLIGRQYRNDHYVYGSPEHPHAVTAVGAAAYSYDSNGSMTGSPIYSLDPTGTTTPTGSQTLAYDVFNRMVAMGVTSYAYDADSGRVLENGRVFANDDFFVSGGGSVTVYVPFGDERIAKLVSDGGATTSSWLHVDHLGSVVNESDSSGSTAAYGGEQDFFPFGTPVFAGKQEPFGFTGQLQDSTSGIVYLHARYYDPYIGRFMSADTASPADAGVGVNRYAYMLNDPLGGSDRSGHQALPSDPAQREALLRAAQLTSAPPSHFQAPSLAMDRLMTPVPRPVCEAQSCVQSVGFWQALNNLDVGFRYHVPIVGSLARLDEANTQIRAAERVGLTPNYSARETAALGLVVDVGLAAVGAAARAGAEATVTERGSVEAPGAARSVPQALGRGSTANLSKGTTLARNLREQLAIEQAMSNPAAGAKLPLKMTDPRWPDSEGWVKMQQVIQPGGEPINVHYLLNQATGAIDDFKIVLPGPR